jgi:ABC-type transport system substrate-binding protein
VVFRLARPSLDWLEAFPFLIPARSGTDPVEAWPSAAPFRVAAAEPGTHLLLERNPRYWEPDGAGRRLPYLSQLEVVFAASGGELEDGFR